MPTAASQRGFYKDFAFLIQTKYTLAIGLCYSDGILRILMRVHTNSKLENIHDYGQGIHVIQFAFKKILILRIRCLILEIFSQIRLLHPNISLDGGVFDKYT